MYNSDLDKLSQLTDEDIDYSDIPPLTDEQLVTMKPLSELLPQAVPPKVELTIRLEADIVKWFKDEARQIGGDSYQTLLNTALRQYIESRKEPLEETLRRVIREELQVAKS